MGMSTAYIYLSFSYKTTLNLEHFLSVLFQRFRCRAGAKTMPKTYDSWRGNYDRKNIIFTGFWYFCSTRSRKKTYTSTRFGRQTEMMKIIHRKHPVYGVPDTTYKNFGDGILRTRLCVCVCGPNSFINRQRTSGRTRATIMNNNFPLLNTRRDISFYIFRKRIWF